MIPEQDREIQLTQSEEDFIDSMFEHIDSQSVKPLRQPTDRELEGYYAQLKNECELNGLESQTQEG